MSRFITTHCVSSKAHKSARSKSVWGVMSLALSLLAARVGVCQTSISVVGIEVIQTVQSLKNDVPLVAGKTTVVRVYLDTDDGTSPQVTGTLEASEPGGVVQALPSQAPAEIAGGIGTGDDARNKLEKTLNFILSNQVTSPGQVSFRVNTINRTSDGAAVVCVNCEAYKATVEFEKVAPLRLVVIGLSYTSDQTTYAPTKADYDALVSWIKRIYPISDLTSSYRPLRAEEQKISVPFTCNDVNAALLQIRGRDTIDPRTHYIAIVSDKGFSFATWGALMGMRGCANVPNSPNPGAVASSPVFSDSGTDLPKTGSYVGHELAHTFGRKHPGFCDDQDRFPPEDSVFYPGGYITDTSGAAAAPQYVGLDVGSTSEISKMSLLPGNRWYDIMTYCSNEWIADYTYSAILKRLNLEDQIGPVSNGGRPLSNDRASGVPATGGFIHVVASADLSRRTASIKFATQASQFIGDPQVLSSEVSIIAKDAAGNVMSRYPVLVRPDSDVAPNAPRMALIDTSIPNAGSPASLEISFEEKAMPIPEPLAASSKIFPGERIKFNKQGGLFSVGSHQLEVTAVANTRMNSTQPVSVESSAEEPEADIKRLMLKWDTTLTEAATEASSVSAKTKATYTVQYSDDEGKSWNTVAVGLENEEYTFKPQQYFIAKGTHLTVRVIADRGFASTATTTRKLTVQ